MKFKPEVTEDRVAAILQEHGAELITEYKDLHVHRIKIARGASVELTVKRLSTLQEVEYAEPNYTRTFHEQGK